MRFAIQQTKPDAVVHLGDYYEDGQTMAAENPGIPFHIVPGNCDRGRCPEFAATVLCCDVCGVRLFMTHGHNHHVKLGLFSLLKDAREANAQAALFGHTHDDHCRREEDGLWVLNPGSCSSSGGSVGLIETEDGSILRCRILRQADLETM